MNNKVLIVEDDKQYAHDLAAELARVTDQVIFASDGDRAIAKAKTEKPDIIVLDVVLPKKLGLAVIKDLKSSPKTSTIPIIAISNFGGSENEEKIKSLGAQEFIFKKKTSIKKVIDTIATLLNPLK